MDAEYWLMVTIPVLDAIGQLEEVGDSEGVGDIKVEEISERSGVSLDKVKILLRRLSVDETDWVAATWGSVRDPLDPCWIRGLGPKGLETVRGFPGQAAIVDALERLADEAEDEEQRGILRRAAALVAEASTQAIATGFAEFFRRRYLDGI